MNHIAKAAAASALFAAIALSVRTYGEAATTPVTFTAAQASAGASAFATNCATCHGAHLEGGAGPALSGPNFLTLSTKIHATVSDIFTYMTTNMPLNAPASLSHTEYVNIMSFILSKNGYTPGGAPMTFASASASKGAIVKN